MQIHNFFTDLLLSVRTLFDTIIFPNDYMKSYEFNVANRTFTLSKNDYKTQYEFPAVIVNLNQDTYSFGERTTVIQNTPCSNMNQILVLADTLSPSYAVLLQEEQTQVSLSIIVNCESQFQAKEIEFRIKRYLPLNKYITLFNFTSFLEISDTILQSLGMKFHDHEIANLFTRLNSNIGQPEWCYAVNYKPLLRLESTSASLADSGQRSFPLNLEITYQIQMPMWICAQHDPKIIEQINVDFVRFGNEPISSNSIRPIYNNRLIDKMGNTTRFSKRNLLIHNLEDHKLVQLTENKGQPYEFTITFNKDDFVIYPSYEYDIFDINGILRQRVKPRLVEEEFNRVTFEFSQSEFNNRYKATLTNPIIIQFMENRITIEVE